MRLVQPQKSRKIFKASTGDETRPRGGVMAVTILDLEHSPLLERLSAVLEREPRGEIQQIAIELLTVRHAIRPGDVDLALRVADEMHKHVRLLIHQWSALR